MKPFHVLVLVSTLFILITPACSQTPTETIVNIEDAFTVTSKPTSTSTLPPPTITPIPPTLTPNPSPTIMNLESMVEEFEDFLTKGEDSANKITLSDNHTIRNKSSQVIAVADISDLLAYYEQVDAAITLQSCEQEDNVLTCSATEFNQWTQASGMESIDYEEFIFSHDSDGKIQEITISLSPDSTAKLESFINFSTDWLEESKTAVAYTNDKQLILNEASGKEIELLLNAADENAAQFESLFLASEAAFHDGEIEQVIEIYDEILTLHLVDDLKWTILEYRAEANNDLGNYTDAIEDFLLAYEINPENTTTLNNLCWNYGITEQPELALPFCEDAVALEPYPSAELDSRGLVYGLLGDYEAAIADFEIVVRKLSGSNDPELAQIAEQRASWITAMEAGENPFTKEVMAELRGEITPEPAVTPDENTNTTTEPVTAVDHFNLARDLQLQGDFDGALAHYNAAIEINPQYENAYQQRGILFRFLGQPQNAIADYDQVIALNPQNAEVYHLRGLTHGTLGDWDQAFSDYGQSINLNSQNPDVFASRAAAYMISGQIEATLTDLNQAIALGSQEGFIYFTRGVILANMGDFEQAITDTETALALGLPAELQGQAEAFLTELKQ